MSLALFHSELRTAVRAAQDDAICTRAMSHPRRPTPPQVDLLRQVARGELSVEAALKALKSLP